MAEVAPSERPGRIIAVAPRRLRWGHGGVSPAWKAGAWLGFEGEDVGKMAKKKVSFELKQDVLAMCNNRIRDRLFKKPISVKPKDYLFTGTVDIEVADPSWNKKAIERSLMLNIKRSMQLLSVRASKLLEDFDKEADPQKPGPQVKKLNKALLQYGTEVAEQAEYNLEQIIDDITKDVSKWGKAGETVTAMKALDNGKKDLDKTVASLKKSLIDAADKIEMHMQKSGPKDIKKKQAEYDKTRAKLERKRKDEKDDYNLEKNELLRDKAELGEEMRALGIGTKSGDGDKPEDGGKKLDAAAQKKFDKKQKDIIKRKKELKKRTASYEKKMARFDRDHRIDEQEAWDKYKEDKEQLQEATKKGIEGVIKDAESSFATYSKESGDYCRALQATAKKMHKTVDSKSANNPAIAELQNILKKRIKPAAVAFNEHLVKCEKKIQVVVDKLEGNKVSETEITAALPKEKHSKPLFDAFKAARVHMKAERIE